MKEIIKVTREDILDILGVTNNNLKQIIKRKQLEGRLKEKGYIYIDKEKIGRNTLYYAYKCNTILFINPNYNKIDNFKVDYDKRNNKGIYYICDGLNIYIGSTINFRKRFLDHWNGENFMKHTYDLLHNGGEFNILYDMTNIDDVELIRMVENEYIQYFKEYTDFNVINHMNEASWKGKNTYKQKYKRIKIKSEDYEKVLKLLEDNGIEI